MKKAKLRAQIVRLRHDLDEAQTCRPDATALHSKILSFVTSEFARKEGRQCIAVDLLFAPGDGFRNEEIRKWVREEEPERFDVQAHVEHLVTTILKIAEEEVDAKTPGRHRFVVRTHQYFGAYAVCSFTLLPSHSGQALTKKAELRAEIDLLRSELQDVRGQLRASASTCAVSPQPASFVALITLITELGGSLRADQLAALTDVLDMPQKILFMEIMNTAIPHPPLRREGEVAPS